MYYLLIPLAIWGASLAMLRIAHGENGLDIFYRHFSLIGLEGVLCFVMYKVFPISGGNRIFLYFVGVHTTLLFGIAIGSLIRKGLKNKKRRSKALM